MDQKKHVRGNFTIKAAHMTTEHTNFTDLNQFIITYSSSDLSAEQIGVVISETVVMYNIIQDYLDSPTEILLRQVSHGSLIFEFLGDHVVFDRVHALCGYIVTLASQYINFIGPNMAWDITKLAAKEMVRHNTDLKKSEADAFVDAVFKHRMIAGETGSVVEYDFSNKTITIFDEHSVEFYADIKKHAIDRANELAQLYDSPLPPRSKRRRRE